MTTYRNPVPDGITTKVGEAMGLAFSQLPMDDRQRLSNAMVSSRGHFIGGTLHCAGFLRSTAAAAAHYRDELAAKTFGRAAAYAVLDGEVDQLLETLPDDAPWNVVRAGLAALKRAGTEAINAALEDVNDPRLAIWSDDGTEVVGYLR